MNLRTALKRATACFQDAKIAEAGTDAWLLLEYVTGLSRAAYLMEPERELTDEEETRYLALVEKRSERIPLQHLTGVQEFMGYPFQVDASVLIPRQDTEILTEMAAELLRDQMQILDLCTGSGCILISLLKLAQERGLQELVGVGTDLSGDALHTAEKNVRKLLGEDCKEKIHFLQGDLFGALEGGNFQKGFELIVSNPPYIPTGEIAALETEVREYDPMGALDGGADGLDFYRRISKESRKYLKKSGTLLLEIGCEQGQDVLHLLEAEGFVRLQIKKDLAGLDRVISAVYDR